MWATDIYSFDHLCLRHASGTAATRRLSAVSAAFPSLRLCQPAANVEPGPAKQLVPKRAGRKAFGVVNR